MSERRIHQSTTRSHISPQDLARSISDVLVRDGIALGDKLSERELAAHLGLSRTPIRSALQVLAQDGILKKNENNKWVLNRQPEAQPKAQIESESAALGLRLCRDRLFGRVDPVIRESDLMRRYGVSKALLNRALVELAADRIVERNTGYGWRFVNMLDDARSLEASYDVRLAIETASLLLDSCQIDRSRLSVQQHLHEDLIAGKIETITPSELFEINADFHLMLAEFSQNTFFVQIIQQQNDLRRLTEFLSQTTSPGMRRSCEEHLSIMLALEEGDTRRAVALLEAHLRGARGRAHLRFVAQGKDVIS